MPRDTKNLKKGDQEITVMSSSAAVWERNGWTVVDDGNSETDSPEADEKSLNRPLAKPKDNEE